MEGRRSKKAASLKGNRKSGDFFHELDQSLSDSLKEAKAKKKKKGAEKRVSAPSNDNDDNQQVKKTKTTTVDEEDTESEATVTNSISATAKTTVEARNEPPVLQEGAMEAVVVETTTLHAEETQEEQEEEKGEIIQEPIDLGLISPSKEEKIFWRPLSPVVAVANQPQRPRMNNITMASDGILNIRFDRKKMHWPIEATPYGSRNPKCQLHRYLCKIDVRRNVLDCSICGVALCPQCFKLFHTRSDFISNKDKYSKAMDSDWKSKHPPKPKKPDDDDGNKFFHI